MKPFLLFRKFLPRVRRVPVAWPVRTAVQPASVPARRPAPVETEAQFVPVWVGSQLSAYPLLVRKRSRNTAQFYDEWE